MKAPKPYEGLSPEINERLATIAFDKFLAKVDTTQIYASGATDADKIASNQALREKCKSELREFIRFKLRSVPDDKLKDQLQSLFQAVIESAFKDPSLKFDSSKLPTSTPTPTVYEFMADAMIQSAILPQKTVFDKVQDLDIANIPFADIWKWTRDNVGKILLSSGIVLGGGVVDYNKGYVYFTPEIRKLRSQIDVQIDAEKKAWLEKHIFNARQIDEIREAFPKFNKETSVRWMDERGYTATQRNALINVYRMLPE